MEDEVLFHAMNRLLSAEIHTHPYPHFHVDQLFPEDFYQQLIAHLPETSSYQTISKTGRVTAGDYLQRFVLPLEGDELSQLPFPQFLFWGQFGAAIHSEKWRRALLTKFDPYIKKRFGEALENLTFSSTAELVRDHTNYAIGPHTDLPVRVLTLLFYFPRSSDEAHLGTSVYEPLDSNFECDGFAHHSFAGFKKLHTAPFSPNSVFGFVRTNRSFHGREPIRDEGVERNLLNYVLQWKKN